MGFHLSSSLCSSTAPSPYEDASADTLVSAFGSYNPNTLLVASSCFTAENAASCAVPHDQVQFFLSRACSGRRRSDNLQENLPRWFAMLIAQKQWTVPSFA